MRDPQGASRGVSLLRSIGPAIIVASVVLGPGSIVANSKMGWVYGHDMIWVVVCTTALLIGVTALSARLGVVLDGTLCEELAGRAGRPIAALTGICIFCVVACFQFGNNLGVLYSVEPWLGDSSPESSAVFPITVLAILNGATAAALFGFRKLYRPVERCLKFLVGLMIVGFAANLLWAGPSIVNMLKGLLPQLPEAAADPDRLVVLALIGTTFSVAGAFYQSYLVRQKGWTRDDLQRGLFDSVVGISTLGFMSLMIMATAGAVLHENPNVKELNTAADVARQLRPLFGPWATGLFCMGIFAGAFSSFLVNAMIGGTILADGIGKGGSMDQLWPKLFTIAALAVGMFVAVEVKRAGFNTGQLIIVAQAVTVLGNPLLAGSILWLATRRDMSGERAIPVWMKVAGGAGFLVVLLLSIRTAYRLAQLWLS